ncbi:MetQ/NlpA family ABC transporter substrate-binding protein [Alkalicoccobacillus porphyridii]|uniref:Lipoprotein n=1 Tax=Alkalicoccobacillus porphyridii TaxID=2597270 RepID=A0A553ZTH7_9BACI|nr:MetQ/NlpA family ABC transporter substrate-binding protein [Alkalicoccobacillus porphyridii]TSB44781.1 MetQ/NlpA family ABC transporter substrate-binding protein [Alkalicoccobacillus porphyridii]
MKKILGFGLAALTAGVLSACGSSEGGALAEDEITVGVTAGPHEQIMEKVQEIAEADGLTVNLEVFTDYSIPNTALSEGDIDANSYQHKPFLDNYNEGQGDTLVDVATTVNFPMGLYSNELEEPTDITDGSKVALPNDTTNGARALMMFEDAGLITLDESAGTNASVLDVTENPYDLQFIEAEASQLPRQLDEVALAAINTNFATEAGLSPQDDSIYIEPEDSPWVNTIVVRDENKGDPVVQKLIEAYHSDEVKQFIEDEFEGSVIPSW